MRSFGAREALSLPHVGGRPANLEFHDPELEPVIEIHSKHGMFEWMLEESIERNMKVGFVGGSDDHYGQPGACYPSEDISHFASRNGLTALYAKRTDAGIHLGRHQGAPLLRHER